MQTKTRERKKATSGVTITVSKTVRSPSRADGGESKVSKSKQLLLDEQYRDLFDNTSDLIQSVAPDGHFLYTNKAWRDMLGYSEKEVAHLKIWDIISPESMDHCMELFKKVIAGEDVCDIEAVFVAKDGSQIAVEGSAHCRFAEGKPIGTQGFFRDVTKRKQAEAILATSEAKYRSFVETTVAGVASIDLQGNFVFVNEAACEMIGYSKEELIGKAFADFIHPDDVKGIMALFLEAIKHPELRPELEFRVVRKDGRNLWLYSCPTPILYGDTFSGASVIIIDITERKQLEEALQKSERRYKTLVENAIEGIVVTQDGKIKFANPLVAIVSGYSTEELQSMSLKDLVHQDDEKAVIESLGKSAAPGTLYITPTFRFRTKGGEVRLIHATVVSIIWDDKAANLNLLRDITEQKRAEEALQESEQKFRKFFENAPAYCYMGSPQGTILDINTSALEALGYQKEELIGEPVTKVYAPNSREKAERLFQKWKQTGEIEDEELNIITRKGVERTILLNVDAVRDASGKIMFSVSMQRDITERKRAEEALQASAQQWQTTFDAINDAVFLLDSKGMILGCNNAAIALLGKPYEKILGGSYWEVVQGSPEPMEGCPLMRMLKSHRRETLTFPINDRWLHATADPVLDKAGNLLGAAYVIVDITERKQAEEALAKSEERYRSVLEQMGEAYFEVDIAGNFTFFNDATCRQLGYSREELMGMNYRVYTSKDDVQRVYEICSQIYRTGKPNAGFPVSRIRKGGARIFTENSVFPLRDKSGKIIGFRGVVRDITERKQAEDMLRESQERYRLLADNVKDAIWLMDLELNFLWFSPSCERLRGYTIEEMKAMPLDRHVTPESFQRAWDMYVKCMDDEKQGNLDPSRFYEGEFEFFCKDGSTFWADCKMSFMRDENGKVKAMLFEGTDITERKQAEEALRRSEKNLLDSIENSPLGIRVLDKDGKTLYANRALLDMWGYNSIEELEAVPVKQRYTSEGYAEYMKIIRKRKKGDDALLNYEVSVVRSDGQVRHLSATTRAVLWNGEKQFQVVYQDVTERKRAEEKVKKLYSLQTAIRYINESLLKVDDEPALFEQVCHFLTDVEFIRFCWIGLTDKESLEVKPVAYSGFEDGYLSSLKISLDSSAYNRGPIVVAIKTRQPCTVADIENDPGFPPWREAALKRGYASSLAVPLVHDTEVIGALSIYSSSKSAFGDAEIAFLAEAAADIALGIRTLRLRQELQQSLASLGKALQGTVSALASVAEVRDPYIAGHQQRVTRIAVAIATEMGLPQEQIEGIHVAGTLHDVGKLYVPAEILSKPGKLSEIEFNLVKIHSQASYDILKNVEFSWPVAQIVLQHHERLDGSGYPQGLKDEDILLEAKILAVADVVEAMASHRPYRPALGIGKALEEISQKSGILYDSKVVDACFKLFYDKEFKLD